MYLRTRALRDGFVTTHDSSAASTRARLALRAHDGTSAHFVSGEYEVRIEVRDVQTGQTDTLAFMSTAVATPPLIERIPTLSPTALKPERSASAKSRGIAAGLIIGAATVAMSIYARAENPIRSAIPSDGRARFVGIAVAGGAIAGGMLDRGVPIKGNVAANVITRADHERTVAVVQDANRKRVAEYRVVLRIELENGR